MNKENLTAINADLVWQGRNQDIDQRAQHLLTFQHKCDVVLGTRKLTYGRTAVELLTSAMLRSPEVSMSNHCTETISTTQTLEPKSSNYLGNTKTTQHFLRKTCF